MPGRRYLEDRRLNREAQRERLEAARERLRQERLRRQAGGNLDRLASLILTTMYSSEHIEVSLRIPTATPAGKPVKPAQRLTARRDAVQEATQAYAERRVTRNARVLYGVSTSEEEQLDKASEINFDTVAVTIMDGMLWVARNFKMRTMTNAGAGKLQPAATYSFGPLPPRAVHNVMTNLRGELHANDMGITAVRFLEVRPRPTNDVEMSAPHAEMQLVSYFRGRENRMSIGVSKGVCPGCQAVLRERGVRFQHDRVHSVTPKNWKPPESIVVGIESRQSI